MILDWESGKEDSSDATAAWQAPLWRAHVGRDGNEHRAKRDVELAGRLASLTELPERLPVFAPERLSPVVLDALSAVAARIPVHAFVRESNSHAPVLVMENDYAVNLFNGDVGVVLADGEGGDMRVHFVSADGQDRALAPSRLPRHETVFAMTVHKAEGSEFDDVTLVLPETATQVVTRELLYTAVTRGMKRVTIFGRAGVVRKAIGREVSRASELRERLWSAHRTETDERSLLIPSTLVGWRARWPTGRRGSSRPVRTTIGVRTGWSRPPSNLSGWRRSGAACRRMRTRVALRVP